MAHLRLLAIPFDYDRKVGAIEEPGHLMQESDNRDVDCRSFDSWHGTPCTRHGSVTHVDISIVNKEKTLV